MKNPNCDGEFCIKENGEVRLLPTTKGSNAILCNSCYNYELTYRRRRQKEGRGKYEFPKWQDLKVYEQ